MTGDFDFALFDLGGVVSEMNPQAMLDAAIAAGIDPLPGFAFYRSAYDTGEDNDHPFHRAERGELTLDEFFASVEPQFGDVRFMFSPDHGAVGAFMRPSPSWASVVHDIRGAGIGLGVLSNTMPWVDGGSSAKRNPMLHAHIRSLFDADSILESHVIGKRKPNPEAFRYACEHFAVDPSRVLFIDDEPGNCAGARSVGMTAVHVPRDQTASAVAQDEVRRLLGLTTPER